MPLKRARADAAAHLGRPLRRTQASQCVRPMLDVSVHAADPRFTRAHRMPPPTEAVPPRGHPVTAAYGDEALLRTPSPESRARTGIALAACAQLISRTARTHRMLNILIQLPRAAHDCFHTSLTPSALRVGNHCNVKGSVSRACPWTSRLARKAYDADAVLIDLSRQARESLDGVAY
jgi:hypothetical protein